MSHREYTQNVKIDMPPLITKIRHDAFVKINNCDDFICRKLSQLEISKFGRKSITIYRDTISFHKYADVIICKLEFWVRRPLWWRHELIEGQMWHETISPNHTLSKYEKKLGSPCILKSKNGFCIGMFLPIYAMYYKSSRARRFMLNGRSFLY